MSLDVVEVLEKEKMPTASVAIEAPRQAQGQEDRVQEPVPKRAETAPESVAKDLAADEPKFEPLPLESLPREDDLITEDDTPVDNFYAEKQHKFLTHTLHATSDPFGEGRSFIAVTNVGLYGADNEDPLVPDVMVSRDVTLARDIWEKGNRSYLNWRFGKAPDAVIEVVSNKVGNEDTTKRERYARVRVAYYVIYDPEQQLDKQMIRVYELRGTDYVLRNDHWLPDLGLGVVLWEGEYEGRTDSWLRWCDSESNLLPTDREQTAQERQRAEQEQQKAEQERQRADAAEQQIEQLLEQLRAAGIDPNLPTPAKEE